MATPSTVTVTINHDLAAEILRLRVALREIIAEPFRAESIAGQALIPTKSVSQRGRNWLSFADQVFHHIEDYTVPQYGDKGSDQVTEWTGDDCAKQVKKYLDRRGRNARVGQELLDMLKSAHYVQLTEEKDHECKQLVTESKIPRCIHCGAGFHYSYPHVCLTP